MQNSAEFMTLNCIYIPSVDCAITQVIYYDWAQIKNGKLLVVCLSLVWDQNINKYPVKKIRVLTPCV